MLATRHTALKLQLILGILVFGLLGQHATLTLVGLRCGPPFPHSHVLIGGATPEDLSAHLRAERECAPGTVERVTHTAFGGLVISVVDHDQTPVSAVTLALFAVLPLAFVWLAGLRASLEAWQPHAFLKAASLRLSPPTPPPEFA